MTPADLLAQIQSDPALSALAAAGDDAGIAGALNAPGAGTLPRAAVPRGEMLEVAVGLNAYPALAAARDSGGPAASLAWATLLMLADPASSLDFTRPATAGLLAGLDQIAPGLGAALDAIGSRPASRAELLGGAGYAVTHSQVSAALAPTRTQPPEGE